MSIFGDRIKTARKTVDMTQSALAERLNVAVQTLNKYEKGHRVPDIDLVNRMAVVLDVDIAWLMTGRGGHEVGERPAPPVVAEEGARFVITIKDDVAEHNSGIIERWLGQVKRIIEAGDYKKTLAVGGVLDALDPKKEE